MKTKEDFILRKVGDETVVVAVGDSVVTFNAMLKLNESSEMLFTLLQAGATREELAQKLLSEYDIDEATARKDADAFVEQLLELGVISE